MPHGAGRDRGVTSRRITTGSLTSLSSQAIHIQAISSCHANLQILYPERQSRGQVHDFMTPKMRLRCFFYLEDDRYAQEGMRWSVETQASRDPARCCQKAKPQRDACSSRPIRSSTKLCIKLIHRRASSVSTSWPQQPDDGSSTPCRSRMTHRLAPKQRIHDANRSIVILSVRLHWSCCDAIFQGPNLPMCMCKHKNSSGLAGRGGGGKAARTGAHHACLHLQLGSGKVKEVRVPHGAGKKSGVTSRRTTKGPLTSLSSQAIRIQTVGSCHA